MPDEIGLFEAMYTQRAPALHKARPDSRRFGAQGHRRGHSRSQRRQSAAVGLRGHQGPRREAQNRRAVQGH